MDLPDHAGEFVLSVVVPTGLDEFTVWHRAQLLDIFGLDLSEPEQGPPPEMVLDWRA